MRKPPKATTGEPPHQRTCRSNIERIDDILAASRRPMPPLSTYTAQSISPSSEYSPSVRLQARYEYAHVIPIIRLATYNVTSLHLATSSDPVKRRAIMGVIRMLLSTNLVLCLQETHAHASQAAAFLSPLINHAHHIDEADHGLITLYHKSLASAFDINFQRVIAGRVLLLSLVHRRYGYELLVYNIYLSSGDPPAQLQQLRALDSHIGGLLRHPKRIITLAGDFNFNPDSLKPGQANLGAYFSGMTARLRLLHARSPAPTYVSGMMSSTIDHVLVGSDAEGCMDSALAGISLSARIFEGRLPAGSSHTPLCLHIGDINDNPPVSTTPRGRRPAIIPDWVARSTLFRDRFSKWWLDLISRPEVRWVNRDPIDAMRLFTKKLHHSAEKFIQSTQHRRTQLNRAHGEVTCLMRRLKALLATCPPGTKCSAADSPQRTFSTPSQPGPGAATEPPLLASYRKRIRAVFEGDPAIGLAHTRLADIFDSITAARHRLTTGADDHLAEAEVTDPVTLTADEARSLPRFLGAANISHRIARLHGYNPPLLHNSTLLQGAEKEAVLHGHYTSLIGSECTDPPRRAKLLDLLVEEGSPARARFCAELFPYPRIEDMAETLFSRMKHSAPGYSGLPLRLLQLTQHLYIPIAFAVLLQFLQSNGSLPKSGRGFFNVALLVTLIKKPDLPLSVSNSRGISINCFTNRHIAASVVYLLEHAFSQFITADQFAFLPARIPTFSTATFLDSFYSAVRRRRKLFVLMTDFQKAYDNVDHSLLLSLARLYGMPTHWVNVLSVFHSHCSSRLSLNTTCTIAVLRGVKQGCPLAGMIFLIYMQTLADLCRKYTLRPHLFADDLNMFFDSLERLVPIFRIFRRFGTLTGFHLSVPKTHLLCTLPLTQDDMIFIRKALPGTFKGISLPRDATMMGMLFGRTVSIAHTFERFLAKAEQRAYRFRHLSMGSVAVRTIFFNTRVLPILQYPGQFLLFPQSVIKRINATIRLLLLPRFSSVPLALVLADPEHGGLIPSLQDPEAMNIAATIRCLDGVFKAAGYRGDLEEYTFHASSPLHSLQTARDRLRKWGVEWDDSASQKDLYLRIHGILGRNDVGMSILRERASRRVAPLIINDWTFFDWAQKELGRFRKFAHSVQSFRWMVCNALCLYERFKHFPNYTYCPCPLCLSAAEDMHHFAYACPFTRAAWRHVTGLMQPTHYMSRVFPSKAQIFMATEIVGIHPLVIARFYDCLYRLRCDRAHSASTLDHTAMLSYMWEYFSAIPLPRDAHRFSGMPH